jgi:site-specific DNA-methyltransferase (adenine-specific)
MREEASRYVGPYALDSIITGDARELAAAIPDDSVDLVVTDPPYGIGYRYGHTYHDNPSTYLELFQWIVTESQRVTKPGGLIFIFQAMPRLRETWALCPPESRLFAACKTFGQIYRDNRVQYCFDPVIFWQQPGGSPEGNGRDWHVGQVSSTQNRGLSEAGFHTCPRPLDTICYMVDHFSDKGHVVVDWFIGSGTTAVACRLLGRHFVGFEVEPHMATQARARVHTIPPRLPFDEPEQLAMEHVMS